MCRLNNKRESMAIVFHPKYLPHVERLNPTFTVYFVVDAHSMNEAWNQRLAEYERRLVERACLIVGFSQGMLQQLPGVRGRSTFVLPTGVDVGHFEREETDDEPSDLKDLPRPRIGYVGRINQKLDLELLLKLVEAERTFNWVFVGPRVGVAENRWFNEMWDLLTRQPNVHVLGPKRYEDVPGYMRHMNVNTLCYRNSGGWWKYCHPLKLYEYLAAGQPVVSSRMKAVMGHNEVVDFADSFEEWMSAIRRAIDFGGSGSTITRRAVARENTWDARVEELEELLLRAIDGGRYQN